MQVLRRDIKKAEIKAPKTGWYSVINDEIRFFVDEKQKNSSSNIINVINWRTSQGLLNTNGDDYSKDYEKLSTTYKSLTGKIFIKSDFSPNYNEYFLNSWFATPNGVIVILK